MENEGARDWYGIKEIKIQYLKKYGTSMLYYGDCDINVHLVEDPLKSGYDERCGKLNIPATQKGFARYLRRHRQLVFRKLSEAIEYADKLFEKAENGGSLL